MLNYRCRKIFIFYTLMVPCTSDSYVLTPSKSVDISRCSSHDILRCYQYIRKLSSSEALPSYCIHCYGNFISAFYDLTFASKWFINISTNSFKILLGSSLKIGSSGNDQFWSFKRHRRSARVQQGATVSDAGPKRCSDPNLCLTWATNKLLEILILIFVCFRVATALCQDGCTPTHANPLPLKEKAAISAAFALFPHLIR